MKLITILYSLPVFAVITLTNIDNGKTIDANLGENINIKLTAESSAGGPEYSWSAAASSDPSILAKTSSSTAPNGNFMGVFRAEGAGSAELSSSKNCAPVANHACPKVVSPWKVTINVQ